MSPVAVMTAEGCLTGGSDSSEDRGTMGRHGRSSSFARSGMTSE